MNLDRGSNLDLVRESCVHWGGRKEGCGDTPLVIVFAKLVRIIIMLPAKPCFLVSCLFVLYIVIQYRFVLKNERQNRHAMAIDQNSRWSAQHTDSPLSRCV